MSKSKIALVSAAFLALSNTLASANGVDASYGFRSGAAYGQVIWPNYQLAQQEMHNGFPSLSGDQFDTPEGVSFNNYTGNLAFFDRDNLQTRPAGLIANEAWWTNVKTKRWGTNNNMESCDWGIGFFNSASGFANTVTFDIAVASPIEIPEIMNIVVSDPDNEGIGTYIDLVEPDSGVTVAVESFTSLNSPFCYAARVHLDMNTLFADKMSENPELDESNYGIEFIDFRLDDFSTPNGLVQVAIDNLVVGNALPKTILAEPVTHGNETPAAPDTEVQIVFTSNPPNPPAPNTIYVNPGEVTSNGAGFEVTSYYESQYINSSTAAMGGGLPPFNWNAVLTTSTQEGSTGPVAPGENDLGTVNLMNSLQEAAQNLTTGIQLTLPNTDNLIVPPTIDQTILSDYNYGETLVDMTESVLQFTLDQLDQFGPEVTTQRYFVNYSFEDYQQWLQQTGSPSFLGDAGYTTIPLTDEFGSITGYGFDFWMTGFDDRSINFIYSAVAVPEPTVLTMLGALGVLGLRCRR